MNTTLRALFNKYRHLLLSDSLNLGKIMCQQKDSVMVIHSQ